MAKNDAATRSAATDRVTAPQTYQLRIRIAAAVRVRIGRLGTFDFPAGDYAYTGSARKNLEARVGRHLSCDKKMHWHIDYLLAAPGVQITEVLRFRQAECLINRRTAGRIIAPGFGASDCRSGCGSHLKCLAASAQTATP